MNKNYPHLRKCAIEEFDALLSDRGATEHQWQRFFDQNPFVLTESLPLRLSAIYPQVVLESGRPDYVFFEPSSLASDFGFYGVIELKRPQDRILRVYSSKHIYPTSATTRAKMQVERYLEDLSAGRVLDSRFTFAVGNAAYAFIIIGNTEEIIQKCRTEVFQAQFRNLLPRGLQLIPYDELFKRFRRGIPRQFCVFHVVDFDAILSEIEGEAERNEPTPRLEDSRIASNLVALLARCEQIEEEIVSKVSDEYELQTLLARLDRLKDKIDWFIDLNG
jgi:hypothetical protein